MKNVHMKGAAQNARLKAARGVLTLGTLALVGCIVVPQTREVYDPACKTVRREVVLEATQLGPIGHCHREACAGLLAAAGLVTLASVVVSGSIAVVGNVVYWIERQGSCTKAPSGDGAKPPNTGALPAP